MNASYRDTSVLATATFTIPYTGDKNHFSLRPTLFSGRYYDVKINSDTIVFKIRPNYVRLPLPQDKIEEVQSIAKDVVDHIKLNLDNLSKDFNNYNRGLQEFTFQELQKIEDKAKEIQDQHNSINPFI